MQSPFGPERARPRAVVYVHLSAEALTAGTGIARVEDVGPILLSRLRLLLGELCTINLKPVIDLPAGHIPSGWLRDPGQPPRTAAAAQPADVFPYAAAVSRSHRHRSHHPYLSPDKGGPPGQTRIGNLGPHVRRHHRLKTHGGWQVGSQNPASGCGDHPTNASTWSTPPAPTRSATPSSQKRSGVPRAHRRHWRANQLSVTPMAPSQLTGGRQLVRGMIKLMPSQEDQ